MKKLSMLISTLLVLSGLAVGETAGPMLKISALSGEVDTSIAGADFKPAILSQELNNTDKIRTKNGKAELLFSEGTTIKIKENSFLDLQAVKCIEKKQSSSLKLLYGGVKAKVTKLKEGASFEVQTPKVIAAIKGTEFVLGTTDQESELRVLEGVVALYDLKREKELLVKENEKASFRDGSLGNKRDMDPGELQNLRENFDASASLSLSRGAMSFSPVDEEKLKEDIKTLRSDLAEVKDRSNLENQQDLLERISDVQLGKTAMDMHGYRVRTDNYVLRPQANILQILNITKREGGPDAGISSFEINDTFNTALPINYMDVKVALRDKIGWLTNGTLPTYWLTNETAAIRNPHGDVILDVVTLTQPVWNQYFYEQPFNETFSINANVKWTHELSPALVESYTNNLSVNTGMTKPYTETPSITLENAFLIRTVFGDGTFLETYRYYVDDAGIVQPLTVEKRAETLSKPNLNWELVYKASEFGTRSIDLLIIPEIFRELF